MDTRALGLSGPNVSVVGLGGNNFGRPGSATEGLAGTVEVLDAALEAGVTFIDTAEMYGAQWGQSESLIGEALVGKRADAVIATKFGHADYPAPELRDLATGRRDYIRQAIELSLTRLRTDWVDLYQQHTPDPNTPIEETVGALDELVAEGKIRAYGCSNISVDQLRDTHAAGSWVSVQDEYSLLHRQPEDDLLPTARELGMSFLPYYPLANGLLSGKFTRDSQPADSRLARSKPELLENAPWDQLDSYAAFCAERGITMLQATFGWMLHQSPVASVIAGATRAEQVVANAAAAGWTPTADEVMEIARIFPRN